jgi:hypothetical protein
MNGDPHSSADVDIYGPERLTFRFLSALMSNVNTERKKEGKRKISFFHFIKQNNIMSALAKIFKMKESAAMVKNS